MRVVQPDRQPRRRPGRILFVTSWRPDERGTGPSQRAFHTLAALGAIAPTTVLELPPFAGSSPSIEERVASLCRGEPSYLGHARAWLARDLGARRLAGHDTIHLFRAYSMVALDLLLESSPGATVQVDLDDLDTVTLTRIAGLHLRNGEPFAALRDRLSAAWFARLEARVLARADRVFVSSAVDRARIASRMPPGAIGVLPNVVTLPEERRRAPGSGAPRFLFVGACGYYPNADAVRTVLACGERLARAGLGAAIDIVGPGSVEVVRRFGARAAGSHAVRAHGLVPDVAPFLAAATALLVPLRAGGGTRIKILEALAHGTPVVASTLAVEGLEVEEGVHFLRADGVQALAAQATLLAHDPALRERLAQKGRAWVAAHHGPERMREVFEESA